MNIKKKSRIVAADDDFDEGTEFTPDDFEDNSIEDSLDDMADTLDDLQEDVDDIKEDDVDIDIENNIKGHYIAECDKCKGIFISAVIESEQEVESISGVCPLCDKESTQFLKWVIKEV